MKELTAEQILKIWLDRDISYSESAIGAMKEFAEQERRKAFHAGRMTDGDLNYLYPNYESFAKENPIK